MSKTANLINWGRGITLNTPQTKMWSGEQLAASDEIEQSMIFANFTAEDQGRSRVLIATVDRNNPDYESNVNLIVAAPKLLASCEFFLKALDDGLLVRNISGDDDPGWALKMLGFVQRLEEATSTVAQARKL